MSLAGTVSRYFGFLMVTMTLAGASAAGRPPGTAWQAIQTDPVRSHELPGPTDVSYVLTTVTENGRRHYFGVGGIIDRIQNPLLIFQQGARVALTLVNVEETIAEVGIPALGIQSSVIVGKGAGVTLTFEVDVPGEYFYGSRDDNLRASGLQGRILVLPAAHEERSDSCSPW